MLLRASSKKALFPVALAALVVTALSFFGCKPRKTSESGLKDEVGYGYTYDNYHGPNMSDPACAADPNKCVCVLYNESDRDEIRNLPANDPKKKDWFRQCIGQEIWYKATGGSARFHGYFAPQKLGFAADVGWVLHTSERQRRWDTWGAVNDPDCCTPRSRPGANDGTCPQSVTFTQEDTYGFDFCPGDEVLLQYVGAKDKDYTLADPACNISKLEDKMNFKVRVDGGDDTGPRRYDSCHLAFGTSSGTLQLRKFPNPRFDKEKWRKLNNGSLSSWENFTRRPQPGQQPNWNDDKGGKMRLEDHSVEPPFLVAQSCGSCHIGYDPRHPPADPNNPKWSNIHGVIGNTFLHFSEILGSATTPGSVPHELFLHARPGTVDTSAVTHDYVHNPGTFNAIINFDRRPGFLPEALKNDQGATFDRFKEDVTTYRQGPDGNYAESTQKTKVAHILKGGEDSIAGPGGVQRVYINIFSCTAACLGNHLDDLRVVSGRGARQTPFELEQCRRDCPAYAAIEDRVYDEIDFLIHVRPTDLAKSKDPPEIQGGVDGEKVVSAILEKKVEGGEPGSWYAAGKQVFGDKCAKCHSSMPGQDSRAGMVEGASVRDIDVNKFVANVDKRDEHGVRLDWLGSDVQIPAKVVGTYRCRALHSNHLQGHLWEAYASDTYRSQERYSGNVEQSLFDFPIEGLNKDNLGGRGFYRNISLQSLWAHAPFMHNNAMGWEWKNPYFDIDRGSNSDWKKLQPIPTVKQRLKMFEESINNLFLPEDKRERTGNENYKVSLTSSPIKVPVAVSIPEIPAEFFSQAPGAAIVESVKKDIKTISIGFPRGLPVPVMHSARHKQIIFDLMQAVKAQDTLDKKLIAAKDFLKGIVGDNPTAINGDTVTRNLMSKHYVNCGDKYDNKGHEFADFNETEKAQLIDFLKTL